MKSVILAALAAIVAVMATTSAEARRSRPSDENETTTTSRSTEARNFWEDTDEKPARRTRQARVVSNDADEDTPRPSRRRASRSGSSEGYTPRESVAGVGPRPGAWCGWYMRTQLGGGPDLNLAWNWSRWGSAASPQVGAVVVWRHHVGMITGQASNGQWIVKSGNDSGRVRERARSVSGAVFRVG
jgi:hypothetical protein